MKKLITLIIATLLVLSMAGCSVGSADVSEQEQPEETEEETSTAVEMNETAFDNEYATCTIVSIDMDTDKNSSTYGMYIFKLVLTNKTDGDIYMCNYNMNEEDMDTAVPAGESHDFTVCVPYENFDDKDLIHASWFNLFSDQEHTTILGNSNTLRSANRDLELPQELYDQMNATMAADAQAEAEEIAKNNEKPEGDLNIVLCDNEYGKVVLNAIKELEDTNYNYYVTVTNNYSGELKIYCGYDFGFDSATLQPGESVELWSESTNQDSSIAKEFGLPEDETVTLLCVSFYDPNLEWEDSSKDGGQIITTTGVGKTVFEAPVFLTTTTYQFYMLQYGEY